MTPTQIAAVLDAHHCVPGTRQRRDADGGRVWLFTIRCRACGEIEASESPLPPILLQYKHQARKVAAALRAERRRAS